MSLEFTFFNEFEDPKLRVRVPGIYLDIPIEPYERVGRGRFKWFRKSMERRGFTEVRLLIYCHSIYAAMNEIVEFMGEHANDEWTMTDAYLDSKYWKDRYVPFYFAFMDERTALLFKMRFSEHVG